MRKLLALTLVACLAVSMAFVGCAPKQEAEETTPQAPPAEQTAPADTAGTTTAPADSPATTQ
jgi:uncharacterized lipoprotein YajG